jgi:hypothetical protein
VQFVVARRLLPDTTKQPGARARTFGLAGLMTAALVATALMPGLSSRIIVVATALAVFAGLGWTHMLDSDDRSYVRGLVVRASARFRVA